MPLGDRALDAAMAAARDVEQSLVVRDEVWRLPAAAREPVAGPAGWELVRSAHTELRAPAPRVADPVLCGQLVAVCGRVAAAGTIRRRDAVTT